MVPTNASPSPAWASARRQFSAHPTGDDYRVDAIISPNPRFAISMTTESMRGVLSFVKTVSAGSFAAAARELSITPVAVSKNVGRLERELGVRLLQRSTRK